MPCPLLMDNKKCGHGLLKETRADALKDFEGTMIFVSHDRMFLRSLGSRVLELGGESGTDRHPTVYPGSDVEYVQKLGLRLLASIRRASCNGDVPPVPVFSSSGCFAGRNTICGGFRPTPQTCR